MYNGGKIIAGLVIFLVIVTFPFYSNFGKSVAKLTPSINTPVIQQLDKKECIESKEIMRKEHMKILNEWRDSAVRNGNRVYVNSNGKHYNISFQNTCLNCHSNKDTFCDLCHKYAGVKPYCWDCHFVKEEVRG